MPKVFIHGNPETCAIWDSLFSVLRANGIDDLVALSPPGFGAPLPENFLATREGYRDWIIAQLEALGGKVDLVGHDWGALHVYGVLEARPDLVRSWAADVAGILHSDYIWHDGALVIQTPGVGEEMIGAMFGGAAEETAESLAGADLTLEQARLLSQGMDKTMGECVLSLYRSAAQPVMKQLGERLAAAENVRGLCLLPTEDPYCGTEVMCESVAENLGARVQLLEGHGHWWMFSGVSEAAEALMRHWET